MLRYLDGRVDILLVDLVCQQHQALLCAELDDVDHVLLAQALPRGVAGVDDRERAHLCALAPRLRRRAAQQRSAAADGM